MADYSQYTNLDPTLITAFQGIQKPWAWNPQAANYQYFNDQVGNWVNNFTSQFTNSVGRAPTQDEINVFLHNFVAPNAGNIIEPGSAQSQNSTNYIQQFVGQNYQKAAQDYATQQLQDQQTQANSLADLFRTQGNAAISDTEQSLLDYQSKLFDKLRPNLITSLQSQGLLDTGGMNEAVAGVQGDLANNASNYIAQLKYQNDQAANQIAFGGASAPYYYKQGTITQNPNTLLDSGNTATAFNNNTFLDNLNYQHQLDLIKAQTQAQESLQPSFLRTFGQSTAQNLGAWFNPSTWSGGGGKGGGATFLA